MVKHFPYYSKRKTDGAEVKSPMVHREARRREMLALLQRTGFITLEQLAARFGVTLQTIRRDANEMDGGGLLRRYHGGVGRLGSTENTAYDIRRGHEIAAKRRIAHLVAEHVPDGSSLFINIGTTTEAVARALLVRERLRVITNNLNVAMILREKPDFEVLVTGGQVRHMDGGIIGGQAVDFISQFRADIGIIGISGIEPDGTLMDFDYREVRVARAILDHARCTYLAADHSKFGRNAMVRLGHVEELAALFTDAPPPEPCHGAILAAGIALHIAADQA